MDRIATPLLAMLASFSAAAAELVAHNEWQRHFEARGVRGTFVILEPANDRYLVVDPARARRGFLPASTFKIPNALIGLEVGSITDENEVFPWDGKPKMRAAWERDHTLGSGMCESVVWMFQEIARRTGKQRMREWVEKLDYGNRDIRGGIDLFWLQGNLRVSAMQQVDFLHRLAEGRLPMSQRSQRLVRQALVSGREGNDVLYGKTGSTGSVKEPADWWVGWIERQGRPLVYFAMNLTPSPQTRYEERFAIASAILREAGYRMPARMNDCTNWRWKSRKAASRGPEVMSVAAVTIDQSMP